MNKMEVYFNMNEKEFRDLFYGCLREEGIKNLREFYVGDDEEKKKKSR